jgi:hypothetical protein
MPDQEAVAMAEEVESPSTVEPDIEDEEEPEDDDDE